MNSRVRLAPVSSSMMSLMSLAPVEREIGQVVDAGAELEAADERPAGDDVHGRGPVDAERMRAGGPDGLARLKLRVGLHRGHAEEIGGCLEGGEVGRDVAGPDADGVFRHVVDEARSAPVQHVVLEKLLVEALGVSGVERAFGFEHHGADPRGAIEIEAWRFEAGASRAGLAHIARGHAHVEVDARIGRLLQRGAIGLGLRGEADGLGKALIDLGLDLQFEGLRVVAQANAACDEQVHRDIDRLLAAELAGLGQLLDGRLLQHGRIRAAGLLLGHNGLAVRHLNGLLLRCERGHQRLGLERLAEVGAQELGVNENLFAGGELDGDIAEAHAVKLQRHLDLDGAPGGIDPDGRLRSPGGLRRHRGGPRRAGKCRSRPKTGRGDSHNYAIQLCHRRSRPEEVDD